MKIKAKLLCEYKKESAFAAKILIIITNISCASVKLFSLLRTIYTNSFVFFSKAHSWAVKNRAAEARDTYAVKRKLKQL